MQQLANKKPKLLAKQCCNEYRFCIIILGLSNQEKTSSLCLKIVVIGLPYPPRLSSLEFLVTQTVLIIGSISWCGPLVKPIIATCLLLYVLWHHCPNTPCRQYTTVDKSLWLTWLHFSFDSRQSSVSVSKMLEQKGEDSR